MVAQNNVSSPGCKLIWFLNLKKTKKPIKNNKSILKIIFNNTLLFFIIKRAKIGPNIKINSPIINLKKLSIIVKEFNGFKLS